MLKNKIIAFALLPAIVGLGIGQLYRLIIKPSKHSKTFKKVGFGITIALSSVVAMGVSIFAIINIGNFSNDTSSLNREKYKVLLVSDFGETAQEKESTLLENTSPLVPRSYEYTSRGSYEDKIGSIETEYSKAITQNIAKQLVERYKAEAIRTIHGRYYKGLEFSYKTGIVDNYLLNRGLTNADFDRLKQEKLKDAIHQSLEIMKEKTLTQVDPDLWNVDEVYFLTLEDKILLRKGKEIFVLRGVDFNDRAVVARVKEILGI